MASNSASHCAYHLLTWSLRLSHPLVQLHHRLYCGANSDIDCRTGSVGDPGDGGELDSGYSTSHDLKM